MSVLISLLFILINIFNVLSFRCVTLEGPRSGKGDDDLSSINCNKAGYGFELTSCGTKTYWKQIDGSYIKGNTCYARNGAFGNGVNAVARCCNFGGAVTKCTDIQSAKSGRGDDNFVKAVCPNNARLTGCTGSTYWKNMDGACVGRGSCSDNREKSNTPTYDSCTAQNGYSGGGVWAHARCCSLSKGKDLDCKQFWGKRSSNRDDAKSIAQCPYGYQLTGCSGVTWWKNMDGWYVEGDKCIAHNGFGGNGVWAVAICCRITNAVPTPRPTARPTNKPTQRPTPLPPLECERPRGWCSHYGARLGSMICNGRRVLTCSDNNPNNFGQMRKNRYGRCGSVWPRAPRNCNVNFYAKDDAPMNLIKNDNIQNSIKNGIYFNGVNVTKLIAIIVLTMFGIFGLILGLYKLNNVCKKNKSKNGQYQTVIMESDTTDVTTDVTTDTN